MDVRNSSKEPAAREELPGNRNKVFFPYLSQPLRLYSQKVELYEAISRPQSCILSPLFQSLPDVDLFIPKI